MEWGLLMEDIVWNLMEKGLLVEDVPLVEFMYLVYNTRKPGENICRRFGAVSVQCLLTANKHLLYILYIYKS